MITNSEKPTAMMPGLKKSAILVVAMGEEMGALILGQLEEEEASQLTREIARLPPVTLDIADAILEEG